jgi:tetratricopeptide (TPR) repeat protein
MTGQKTTAPTTHKKMHSKSFTEGLVTLLEEIQLALQWDRPSILLAIHKSKTGQVDTQQSLEQKILKSGKQVIPVQVESANPDVILEMSKTPNFRDAIFFVSGIENADQASDGKVYRALNIRRELLIEKRIRVVFWLNESEAASLARNAPDFWAFRHRAVEFASKHGPKDQALPAGLFLWEEDIPPMGESALQNKLDYYEGLLARLPNEESSMSAHIEILLKLTHYGWLLHDLKKFSKYSNDGIGLLKKYPIPQYQAWMVNAKGIELFEEGNKKEAGLSFTQALSHDPGNSAIKMNTGIATRGLEKGSDAIQIGKQAIARDPENFRLWNTLGYLFLSMGKPEDAIKSLAKAQKLNPHNAEAIYALAICYLKNKQPAECAKELSKAEKISPPQNALQQACVKILSGKSEDALRLLKHSLETRAINKYEIQRDPNLNFLLNPQEIARL